MNFNKEEAGMFPLCFSNDDRKRLSLFGDKIAIAARLIYILLIAVRQLIFVPTSSPAL